MGAVLSIQLSVFSNRKITPSTGIIAIMMPKLKELTGLDYLPSIINTQKIDISTGNMENIPNLSFSTLDKKSQVVCTENRIDCTFNYELKDQSSVDSGFISAMDILQFIMENTKVLANRLAMNINFISNVCSGESKFEKQVMHVVPFYQDKDIKEWSSRTNAKGKMTIDGHEEELNIITEYNHVTDSNIGETRIVCHSDINTVSENKDYRFNYESLNSFAEQAKRVFKQIQADLEEMVK